MRCPSDGRPSVVQNAPPPVVPVRCRSTPMRVLAQMAGKNWMVSCRAKGVKVFAAVVSLTRV
jgi:hypothetical protein